MNVSDIGITEITEVPPPLDLAPEEIEGLADELIAYHAEFVDLYYRVEQTHWGHMYLQGIRHNLTKWCLSVVKMPPNGQ